jgi:acetyl esterase/lipase
MFTPRRFVPVLVLLSCATLAAAGPLRERLQERRAERAAAHADESGEMEEGGRMAPTRVPAGVKVIKDVSYGSDPAQRFDVYVPQGGAHDAPVIFMVHGGGWAHGDKTMQSVVENKAARWVPRGVVFVSANYRMVPAANPLDQARDVARAAAAVQTRAAEWGGNPAKMVLMGHSAGAHLVTLITASPTIGHDAGLKPWLGTVALDSAAYDVEAEMNGRHFGLYDTAFGTDPALWKAASPSAQLAGRTVPLLGVCSTKRRTSCRAAHDFEAKTRALGNRMEILPQDLSHRDINQNLGLPGAYTDSVETFLRSLDPSLAVLKAGA